MNLKFANANRQKKHTNIGTSNKNCTRQQQPSGLIKRVEKTDVHLVGFIYCCFSI
jgi:hypothetical protein